MGLKEIGLILSVGLTSSIKGHCLAILCSALRFPFLRHSRLAVFRYFTYCIGLQLCDT